MIDDLERFEDHPDFNDLVEKEKERLKQLFLSEEELRELIAINRTIFKFKMMAAEILKKANLRMEQELNRE